MSKVVIIGVSGEKDLYMADLDHGTITQVDRPASGQLKSANELRGGGTAIVKGIDFAVAVTPAASAAAGHFDGL